MSTVRNTAEDLNGNPK